MSLTDPVSMALTVIKNAEQSAKGECLIRPASNFLAEILKVAKENGYVEEFDKHEEKGVISYTVKLNGRINTIKAIKPRYAVKRDEFEKYEKRYLPARDVGLIVVSTSSGVMTHTQAKAQKLGRRLIAFMY